MTTTNLLSFECKSCGCLNNIEKSNHHFKFEMNKSTSTNVIQRLQTFNYLYINELENMLVDFTVSVLVQKPNDLCRYASDYFKEKLISNTNSRTQTNDQYKNAVESNCISKTNSSNSITEYTKSRNKHENIGRNIEKKQMENLTTQNHQEPSSNLKDSNKSNNFTEEDNEKEEENDEFEEKDKEVEEEDDDYDEFEQTKLNNRRQMYQSQSRRVSVFSKSFDPESNNDDESNFNEENFDYKKRNLNKIEEDTSDDNENDSDDSSNSNGCDSNVNCFERFQNEKYEYCEESKGKKTREQINNLKKVLKSIILFKHLYEEDIDLIIQSMFERKCSNNEVIIREGEPGNYFYVILNGHFEVFIKTKKNKNENVKSNQNSHNEFGTKISEYVNKGYFGELALLYNQPRSATIICKEDQSTLFCMNRDIFQRLVITSAFKRRKLYEEFLSSVPLLKESMNDYERSQVASCLTTKKYKNGEIIFKQNDEANGIYFIESGCVQVFQEDEDTGAMRDLGKLSRGQFFGEVALINKSPRSATVIAYFDTSNKNNIEENEDFACKLAFMDIDAFERLMGPCLDLLKNKIMSYKS